jgi:hypothetical protein
MPKRGFAMLTVLVLICSMTTPGADCDTKTAIDVIHTAQTNTPQQCGFMGQSMLAPTALAPQPGKQYAKIVCVRQR